MSEIDLHKLSHSVALEKLEDFLLIESQTFGFSCKVITGNSKKLQNKIIENIIKKYKFNYLIPNTNLGIMIIS